jgi:hypothetical protein
VTAGLGRARLVALLPGLLASLLAANVAQAACLTLASYPDGASLAHFAVAADDPTFTVTYVHSVTKTPVDERYRIDGDTIIETEIRFEQHGPGLPTEADAGAQWTRRDGRYVVTMSRRFGPIVMRVHADQKPALAIATQSVDLAQWGNRAVALAATAGPCAAQ